MGKLFRLIEILLGESGIGEHSPFSFSTEIKSKSVILLELTNRCNMNCTFCPYGVMERKEGDMKTDLAKKTVEDIGENDLAEDLAFHVLGEPLLHPDIFEIINQAISFDLNVHLFTNGLVLESEGIRESIIKSQIRKLVVSLSTPTELSFEKRQAKREFGEYEKGIRNMVKEKIREKAHFTLVLRLGMVHPNYNFWKKLGLVNENLDVQYNKENVILNWMNFGKEVCEKYGVNMSEKNQDRNLVSKLREEPKSLMFGLDETKQLTGKPTEKKLLDDFLQIAPDVFLRPTLHTPWRKQFNGYRAFVSGCDRAPAVLSNGEVVLCCKDYEGHTSVGNIKIKNLSDILSTNKVRNIRRNLRRGIPILEACKRCLGAPTLRGNVIKNIIGLKNFMREIIT